jgi:hypothetical protein
MRPSNSPFGIVFHIEELTGDIHAGPSEHAELFDRAHNSLTAAANSDPDGFDPDDLYEFDDLDGRNFGRRVPGVNPEADYVPDPECDHVTSLDLLLV